MCYGMIESIQSGRSGRLSVAKQQNMKYSFFLPCFLSWRREGIHCLTENAMHPGWLERVRDKHHIVKGYSTAVLAHKYIHLQSKY